VPATPSDYYTLFGHIGSPYSMKMRAVLRYRRIAHVWKDGRAGMAHAKTQVRAPVIPVLRYPDGSFNNDSTALIYDLEQRHDNDRSIIPERASDAFLALLIEDMADELLTKAMYHYRWFDQRYVQQVSEWISFDMLEGSGRRAIEEDAAVFCERQMGRLGFVGSSEHNRPMIEYLSNAFLQALESHVPNQWFLFGSRPSIAEFGLFGQLSQYHNDLAIIDHAQHSAPYTYRWILHMHDLSGFEGQWRGDDESLPAIVETLLQIAGTFYFPFLLANAQAHREGAQTFSFEAGGMPYSQGVFSYQLKCLAHLRSCYRDLTPSDRQALAPLLDKTGCLQALSQ